MKKYSLLLSILLAIGITSCSDFLNVTPKNVISMDDMESIKKSMAGFLYNIAQDNSGKNRNSMPWSPFLDHWGTIRQYSTEWDLSKFVEEEFTDPEQRICDWRTTSTQDLWSTFYSPIGYMNLILHEAVVAEGEEDMRDYVMGEAYMVRAYCFFKLLQHFTPYKDNQLGIPVCLETYEDFQKLNLQRKTQKEVYAQILQDLREAEIRLERTPSREGFSLMYTTSVINRLFAEVYHFKALSGAAEPDDWKNAISYAEKETKKYELEANPATLKKIFKCQRPAGKSNQECALLVYTERSSWRDISRNLVTDTTFSREYFPDGEGDIRRNWFYKISQVIENGIRVDKIQFDKFSATSVSWYNSGYIHFGFRLAETYLIQAEALAMSDQLSQAKEVLKRFKTARYTKAFSVPDTKDALLKDIYRERRKEFVAETDMAWLDMKRLGVSTERTIGGITFTLKGEGDYRYTFPIPDFELKNNKYIDQNPGWN